MSKYDERGFIKNTAKHKNGTKYDDNGFDKYGYNMNGTKYDDLGYDINGTNKEGCSKIIRTCDKNSKDKEKTLNNLEDTENILSTIHEFIKRLLERNIEKYKNYTEKQKNEVILEEVFNFIIKKNIYINDIAKLELEKSVCDFLVYLGFTKKKEERKTEPKFWNEELEKNGVYRNKTSKMNKYDENGFIKNTAKHKNGTKYDDNGFDKYGYNINGFKCNGYHKNGTKYDGSGYDSNGFNKEGDSKRITKYDDLVYDNEFNKKNNSEIITNCGKYNKCKEETVKNGEDIENVVNKLNEFIEILLKRNEEKYKSYTEKQISESISEEVYNFTMGNNMNIYGRDNAELIKVIHKFIVDSGFFTKVNKTEETSAEQQVYFNSKQEKIFDLEQEFSKIIGLEEVKDIIRNQYLVLVAQEKRKKAGFIVNNEQTMTMLLTGNPGTGKTTIARVIADMFEKMGILKSNKLVEVDRGGLVGQYIGQTAIKTKEKFMEAIGGVLLIDEAYALSRGGDNDFGKEAIDTLVKLIEDHRNEIVVILTGYTEEMKEFMNSNSGLKSRFTFIIDFADYTEEELVKIAVKIIEERGFIIEDDAIKIIKEEIALLKKKSDKASGNGRMVRNYIEQIIKNQSVRIVKMDVADKELNIIKIEDIKSKQTKITRFELENELGKIVGLEGVKSYIRSLSARIRVQSYREKFGLSTNESQTLNMIFVGYPGTGKTMIARIIAKALYDIGIITTDKLIETTRTDFVGEHIGETSIKTRKKVMEAIDGVLFIDEAYSLYKNSQRDFGREAVDELVKLIDDYRQRLVVIIAGYTKEMDNLILSNSGLKSRFPNRIEFNDYSVNELMEICENKFKENQYTLTLNAKNKIREVVIKAKGIENFGNGRYVRNLYESIINKQSIRLDSKTEISKDDLVIILEEDIDKI